MSVPKDPVAVSGPLYFVEGFCGADSGELSEAGALRRGTFASSLRIQFDGTDSVWLAGKAKDVLARVLVSVDARDPCVMGDGRSGPAAIDGAVSDEGDLLRVEADCVPAVLSEERVMESIVSRGADDCVVLGDFLGSRRAPICFPVSQPRQG